MARPIVSFSPIYEGDVNLWAHGILDTEVLETLAQARAVIFPQVVKPELYYFCRSLGVPVFPNYDWRFRFPGKMGQILMFQALGLPHPQTLCIPKLAALGEHPGAKPLHRPPFPFVVKGNLGHEGQEIFLITQERDWEEVLSYFRQQERCGRFGLLIQEYLPTPFELRVVICGSKTLPVWRANEQDFKANLAQGGKLISCPDGELERQGLALAGLLRQKTGVNLAAIDFLLRDRQLLFNEINYVFGRKALGGGEGFYSLWQKALKEFLKGV